MLSENEYDEIFNIRSYLSSISIDNVDELSTLIISSPYCSSEKNLHDFFDMVFLFASIRPKQIQALCTLTMNIYSAREDFPILENVRDILLEKFHTAKSPNTDPLTSWGYFGYLHMCIIQFLLSDEEIVEEINKFVNNHPGSKEQILFICSWFLPEIEKLNNDLFKLITHGFLSTLSQNPENNSNEILKDFYKPSSIEKLKTNDWSYYRDLVFSAYPPNSLGDAIRSDNFELFKELSNKYGFDINTRLQPSLFLQIPLLQDSPTLIQAAAFFASVNIFKFLLLNNADLKLVDNKKRTLPFFAVAGGSSEIIRTCQQHGLSFKTSTKYAIQFQHQDIFTWLLDTIPNDLAPEVILQESSKWGNLELVHDLLISNMVFSYSDFKFNDFILHLRFTNALTISSFEAIAGDYSQILDILIETNNRKINLDDFREEEEEEEAMDNDIKRKERRPNLHSDDSSNYDSDNSEEENDFDGPDNLQNFLRRLNIRLNGRPLGPNLNERNFRDLLTHRISSNNKFAYRTYQESETQKKKKLKDLLLACSENNSIKCLKIICKELKDDVFCSNDSGLTPLHHASKDGFLEFIQYLLECNKTGVENNPEYVKYDINSFASFNQIDQITPLYLAVLYGHTEVVKYLLDNGALFGDKIHKRASDDNNSESNTLDEIHIAAREGYIQILKLFLHLSPDVNNPDKNGVTPLCYATQNKQIDSVKLLLSTKGVDPNNVDDSNNMTPLSIACNLGYYTIVREFINYNKRIKSSQENDNNNNNNNADELEMKPILVDINKVCSNGRTAIFAAVLSKSVRTVKELLKSNDVQINLHEELNNSTPLHIACELGLTDIAKVLLRCPGIDVNALDNSMNTPLHIASDRGFDQIVKALLSIEDTEAEKAKKLQEKKRKQERKAKRKQEKTKETTKTENNNNNDNNDNDNKVQEEEENDENDRDEEEEFDEEEENESEEEEEDNEDDQIPIQFKININAVNKDNKTPLHLASMNDKSDCLDYLLQYKSNDSSDQINVNCTDSEGNTPLMYASMYDNYYSVFNLLRVERTDVLAANNEKWTALHFAAAKDNDDVIQLLLVRIKSIKSSSNSQPHSLINAKTNGGYTALHLAASRKAEAAMRVLLEEEEVDVNAKCNNGKTPLHFAATYGFVDGAKMLLSHIKLPQENGNIDDAYSTDNIGMTPLMYAQKYKREEIIKLFEKREKEKKNPKA